MVQREATMVFSVLSEGFDMAGDTTMFIAILEDSQDPLRRAAVQAIVVPVCVSFGFSAVISLGALVVRGLIVITQLRRRRRDVAAIGSSSKTYVETLEVKLEDGQRECKQVCRAPVAFGSIHGFACILSVFNADLHWLRPRPLRGRADGHHRAPLPRGQVPNPAFPGDQCCCVMAAPRNEDFGNQDSAYEMGQAPEVAQIRSGEREG